MSTSPSVKSKYIIETKKVEIFRKPKKFISTNFVNENNYRIGGLDTSLANGVKEDTNLYTLKFKVVKAGTSKISIKNILRRPTWSQI